MADATLTPPQRSETDTIADLVEKYLARHQPETYRLVVHRSAIRQGSRRWLVQVGTECPDGVEIHSGDYADRVVAANADLDHDFPRFVRLTSLVPQPGEVL